MKPGWFTGDCGVHQTCIKPRTVQTICFALMGPRGWRLCQLWDHRGVAVGFRIARRCSVPTSSRETSVFGPMRSLILFELTPAFRAPAAYEWRSAMEGHARERGRRGEAVEPAVGSCPDV